MGCAKKKTYKYIYKYIYKYMCMHEVVTIRRKKGEGIIPES